ncbi:MAG: DUF938 domain-containing protein [Proteobacteria bacterium]|nr:DUF938 domain-containing protein [Pseudomonadota bacterium]
MDDDLTADFAMFNRAADNNRHAILEQLERLLQPGIRVLEIGSGSGQHAAHFAASLPGITWQPADREPYFAALDANLAGIKLGNLLKPVYLDVAAFPDVKAEAVFTANVLHIMPERLMPVLFDGVAATGASLVVIYGPFKYGGGYTTPSNERFNGWLQEQHPDSGIRDIERVQQEAARIGLTLAEDVAMPANNQLLVFRRD